MGQVKSVRMVKPFSMTVAVADRKKIKTLTEEFDESIKQHNQSAEK